MCYGVLYPANLSKPICSCNFCKKGGGVNGINTQDSHYLLRLPNDSSKTYCNGMNLHAIYCIPMGGIDARAVLLQHRIVHSALFFKNFCYRGLSLGNSTIRSYHIKYIMQQAFDANLPLKPEEYLLKVIEDLLQTPIRKITIIQERIIPQLESFYQVHQTQFSHNLHLSFNRLFDKWKLIDKDESSDNINIPLDAAQCQALSEHFNISITFLKEIFHTLSKYSLSLHQGK